MKLKVAAPQYSLSRTQAARRHNVGDRLMLDTVLLRAAAVSSRF